MKKRFWFLVFLIFILSSASFSDILIKQGEGAHSGSFFNIGPASEYYNNIEVGANFRITVQYQNHMPNPVSLTGVKLWLDYNTDYIDPISERRGDITDHIAGSLRNKVGSTFTPADGQIRYQRNVSGGSPIEVQPGATIDLITIAFHVNQDALAGPLPAGGSFIGWTNARDIKVNIAGGGSVDFSGTVNVIPVPPEIAGSNAPNFGGINSVEDPGTGNLLNLEWESSARAGSDLFERTATHHTSGQRLRYRVYRREDEAGLGSEITTVPLNAVSLPDSGVDDVRHRYFYVVRGEDDCRRIPNREENVNNQPPSASDFISHDITPPEFASTSFDSKTSQDRQVTIAWPAATQNADDLASYLILRREFSALPARAPDAPPLDLADPRANPATPENQRHGTDYSGRSVGDVIEDGWQFRGIQSRTTLTEQELDNSKIYYYAIYAFDLVGGAPYQQGRNYSRNPVVDWAQPGVPPTRVMNFVAVRGDTPGAINLMWSTPRDPEDRNQPLSYYGGTRLIMTDNMDEWELLTAATTAGAIDLPLAAESWDRIPLENEHTLTSLDEDRISYFRAFAFNQTGDPSTRQYAAEGAYAAALPAETPSGARVVTVEVTTPAQHEITVNLVRQENGLGINTFPVPFTPLIIYRLDEGREVLVGQVDHLSELISTLNEISDNRVTVVSFWDESDQTIKGSVFRDGVEYSSPPDLNLEEITLAQGQAYYISVSEGFSFVVKNY